MRVQDQPHLRFSYRDLTTIVDELYDVFTSFKIAPGGTVALVADGTWLFHPVLMACAAYGAVLVPINSARPDEQVKHILLHASPRLVIAESFKHFPAPNGGQTYLETGPLVDRLLAALTSGVRAARHVDRADPNASVVMPYSSALTGRLNGVMVNHTNLIAAAGALVKSYEITSADVIACPLRCNHMLPIMLGAVMPMVAGASVVLSDLAEGDEAATVAYWNGLEELGVTTAIVNPAIMATLMRAAAAAVRMPRGLRAVLCSGAVTRDLWQTFEERFGVAVHRGYGLSESTGWVTCTSGGKRNYSSVGRPVDCEIRIKTLPNVHPDEFSYDRRQKWRPEHSLNPQIGPLGEIQIRSRSVMPGYFKSPKGTQQVITTDGYLRTGDIGFFDQDGLLHFVGCIKETIVRRGRTIYPRDVDDELLKHELIAEVASVCVPDQAGGALVSVCVPKNGDPASFPSDAVLAWLAERLPAEDLPDRIFPMAWLPLSSGGKISTATLRGIITGQVTDNIVETMAKPRFSKQPPSDMTAMRGIVDRALAKDRTLRFLTFWGAGTRKEVSPVDINALSRLASFLRSVELIPRLKSELTIALHDVHATVNGVSPEVYLPYHKAIAAVAAEHGFATVRMTDLWREAGLRLEDAVAAATTDQFREFWGRVDIRDMLITQASKYARDTTLDTELQAQRYVASCLHDSKMLAERFPDHIFLSYTTSEMDLCLPAMPKCYLYSSRKWTSTRPWFEV